jgi:hypothetical protein
VATTRDELACGDLLVREIRDQAARLGIDVALSGRTVHLTASSTESHTVRPPPKLLGRERSESPRNGHAADGESMGRRR